MDMPVLQGWSRRMRKRAIDRRDRKGPWFARSHSHVGPTGAPEDRRSPVATGVQANIGSLLRAMYDTALHEPVPERFQELLRQMDAKLQAAGASDSENGAGEPE
jgi:hypothetical protein